MSPSTERKSGERDHHGMGGKKTRRPRLRLRSFQRAGQTRNGRKCSLINVPAALRSVYLIIPIAKPETSREKTIVFVQYSNESALLIADCLSVNRFTGDTM